VYDRTTSEARESLSPRPRAGSSLPPREILEDTSRARTTTTLPVRQSAARDRSQVRGRMAGRDDVMHQVAARLSGPESASEAQDEAAVTRALRKGPGRTPGYGGVSDGGRRATVTDNQSRGWVGC